MRPALFAVRLSYAPEPDTLTHLRSALHPAVHCRLVSNCAPFHELDTVVMSPHRVGGGGSTEIEQMRMAALAGAINRLAAGEALPHRVNLELGY